MGISPNEFIAKVILDGKTMSSFGFSHPTVPGTDMVLCWQKARVDLDKLEIRTEMYAYWKWVGEEGSGLEPEFRACTKFFETKPLRCEYYLEEVKTCTRFADAASVIDIIEPITKLLAQPK